MLRDLALSAILLVCVSVLGCVSDQRPKPPLSQTPDTSHTAQLLQESHPESLADYVEIFKSHIPSTYDTVLAALDDSLIDFTWDEFQLRFRIPAHSTISGSTDTKLTLSFNGFTLLDISAYSNPNDPSIAKSYPYITDRDLSISGAMHASSQIVFADGPTTSTDTRCDSVLMYNTRSRILVARIDLSIVQSGWEEGEEPRAPRITRIGPIYALPDLGPTKARGILLEISSYDRARLTATQRRFIERLIDNIKEQRE